MPWDRDTLWRQGHLLTVEAAKALGLCHQNGQEKTLVVVATHDCDLAQLPTTEPNLEVIVGCAIEKEDGNYSLAKIARRLHIKFEGSKPCFAEFEAITKVQLAKAQLADFSPRQDTLLSPSSLQCFQLWLASRYRRSAFPDEFENRLKENGNLAEKISKALRPYGSLISGIFFDVDEGQEVKRVGQDDTYKLDILILHSVEPDFMKAETAAITLASSIKKAIEEVLFRPTNSWKFIELSSCEVVAESVLTYEQFKGLKKWRFEHMSLKPDSNQEILTE